MTPRMGRVGTALALAMMIIALRYVFSMPSDGFLFLLIAPIAIIAVEFAFSGGLVAALLASVVTILLRLAGVVDYSLTGISVRIVAFLVAGAGLGYLVRDRHKREQEIVVLRRREAEHREGLQLNDDVVQGLAVAKMALEMDDKERALAKLDETLKRAQEIASQHLDHGGPLVRSRSEVGSGSD